MDSQRSIGSPQVFRKGETSPVLRRSSNSQDFNDPLSLAARELLAGAGGSLGSDSTSFLGALDTVHLEVAEEDLRARADASEVLRRQRIFVSMACRSGLTSKTPSP